MNSKELAYLLAAALAVTVVAIPIWAGSRLKVGPEDRVLLLGDSLAQGLSRPMSQLAEADGIWFVGDGRVSTRLDQWLDGGWAQEAISQYRPTLVIVSLGTNDGAAPSLMPAFAGRAASFVAMAQAMGAKVLWVVPPTMPARIDVATVRASVEQSGAAIFDSSEIDVERGPDQIHPTIAGNSAWASAIWRTIT